MNLRWKLILVLNIFVALVITAGFSFAEQKDRPARKLLLSYPMNLQNPMDPAYSFQNKKVEAFVEVQAEQDLSLGIKLPAAAQNIWSSKTAPRLMSPEKELIYYRDINYEYRGFGRPNEGELISVSSNDFD